MRDEGACRARIGGRMSTPAERLEVALELSALAEAVMRENLRRRHPNAAPDEIEVLLTHWFATRPGAEHGDAEGRPIDLARFR